VGANLDCARLIAKSIEGLDEKDLDVFAEKLARKQEGLAPGALAGIAAVMAQEAELNKALKLREAFNTATAVARKLDYVRTHFNDDMRLGLTAVTVGNVNIDRPGAQSASAGWAQWTNRDKARSGLIFSLERDNVLKTWRKRLHQDDAADALEALDKGEPIPDVHPDAIKIAKISHELQTSGMIEANKAGAHIRFRPDHIAPQMWDSSRLANVVDSQSARTKMRRFLRFGPEKTQERYNANRREFTNDMMREADVQQMMDEADEFYGELGQSFKSDIDMLEEFIGHAYDGLVTGIHNVNTSSRMMDGQYRNIAVKMSQHRVFHFKDAGARQRMMRKYGAGDLYETIQRGIEIRAEHTALIDTLGPNPEFTMNAVTEALKLDLHAAGRQVDLMKLKSFQQKKLKWDMAELTGAIHVPGNHVMATFFSNLRGFQVITKLGKVMFSAINDTSFVANEMRLSGSRFFGSLNDTFTGYFSRTTGIDQKRLLAMMAVTMDGNRGQVMGRYAVGDHSSGMMAKAADQFLKLAGLTVHTDHSRRVMGLWLARELGVVKDLPFKAIPDDLKRMLRQGAIEDREWEVIRRWVQFDDEGNSHIVPESAETVPDDIIEPMVKEEVAGVRAKAVARLGSIAKQQTKIIERQNKRAARITKRKLRKQEKLDAHEKILRRRVNRITGEMKVAKEILEATKNMAEIEVRISQLIKSEQAITKVQALMDAIDDGTRNAEPAISKTETIITRLTDAQRKNAFGLGERRAELRQRVKNADKRFKDDMEKREGKLSDQQQKDLNALNDELEELAGFVAESQVDFDTLTKKADEVVRTSKKQIDSLIQQQRRTLERKLRSYFTLRVNRGVPTPSPRTRSRVRMGAQSGDLLGEGWISFLQFKMFPLGLGHASIGANIFGRNSQIMPFRQALLQQPAFLSMTQMFLTGTIMGVVGNWASQLSRGQKPIIPETPGEMANTFIRGAHRGGAMGFYGDVMFGEYKARYGETAISRLMGPSINLLDDIFNTVIQSRDLEANGRDFARLIDNNVPFVNLFYTKILWDYLVVYNLHEWISPGSASRTEAAIDEFGAEFYIPPSSVVPTGGGSPLEILDNLAEEVTQ